MASDGPRGPTAAICAAVAVAAFTAGVAASLGFAERQARRRAALRSAAAAAREVRQDPAVIGAASGAADAAGAAAGAGTTDEDALVREQVSRNEQFLGADGQRKLENAFVVVVGVGGVGSHCAHFLARAGVRRLRVVDFDNVTLSSLNRHAVAGREDVGTPKTAALARHIHRFAPHCQVDCRAEMFTEERAADLLDGSPDFVVDCIDDRNTKVALLAYCCINKIPLLSSMAAGAKADPTKVHFAQFRDVVQDPLAARLRWNLKQYLKDAKAEAVDFDSIEVVYSSEKSHMKLLPLDAEVAGEDPSELGTIPNFRVRVVPVLGTMPAIFGMAMAARVITNLAGKPFAPAPAPTMKQSAVHKYRQKLQTRMAKLLETATAQGSLKVDDLDWTVERTGDDEIAALIAQFCQRCPFTHARMGNGATFHIAMWRYDRPIEPSNLVLCTDKHKIILEELALNGKLPTHTELGIAREDYAQILNVHRALQTKRQFLLETGPGSAFATRVDRAVVHMNKDHSEDNLTLVRAYGDCEAATSAELVSLDRSGMVFRCATGATSQSDVRVLFPSRLLEPTEMRETLVKMTLQARAALSAENGAAAAKPASA